MVLPIRVDEYFGLPVQFVSAPNVDRVVISIKCKVVLRHVLLDVSCYPRLETKEARTRRQCTNVIPNIIFILQRREKRRLLVACTQPECPLVGSVYGLALRSVHHMAHDVLRKVLLGSTPVYNHDLALAAIVILTNYFRHSWTPTLHRVLARHGALTGEPLRLHDQSGETIGEIIRASTSGIFRWILEHDFPSRKSVLFQHLVRTAHVVP
mmetsp:Transcript_10502/g.23292  ORF Transcript_10502/g.23292 Transcript_10502/m.23292 type:complete len:210 (-) Transcript_10502:265-894(-)